MYRLCYEAKLTAVYFPISSNGKISFSHFQLLYYLLFDDRGGRGVFNMFVSSTEIIKNKFRYRIKTKSCAYHSKSSQSTQYLRAVNVLVQSTL